MTEPRNRDPLDETVLPPTGITAVACQDYAGAFSCGAKQEGFDIIGKFEQPDNFGLEAWMMNSDWLANPSVYYDAGPPSTWAAQPADVVFGNPPCSGFSQLTAGAKWQAAGLHGAEASQNQCMYDLVGYGSKVDAQVIVFESVSHAATTGLPLMQLLHNQLEEETGRDWHMTLVKFNALSVGGWPDRKRFFFVASVHGPMNVPAATGVGRPLSHAIGDLAKQCSWYEDMFAPTSLSPAMKARRNTELAGSGYWDQGMCSAEAYQLAAADGWNGTPPDRSDSIQNPFSAWRWKWDKPARVATGAVLDSAVHPVEPRTFTHAEVGRIMGFPSQYDLRGITRLRGTGRKLYGKGIPAQTGRWIMEAVRRHLTAEDLDDDVVAEERSDIGSRRYTIDVTHTWKSNAWHQLELWDQAVPA